MTMADLSGKAVIELGDLFLLNVGDFPANDTAWFLRALGEGSTLGNAVPVDRTMRTLAADGSRVVTEYWDNREASFLIEIVAPDGQQLAEAETVLFLECSRPNELRWTPPDGYAATTVYEVETSKLEHEFDDFDELRLIRTYRITLTCAPFGRSPDMTEVSSLTADPSPSSVTISDGTSATGWTAPNGSPLVVSSGRLTLPLSSVTSESNVNWVHYETASAIGTYTAAAPIDFSVTPYLTLDLLRSASYQSRPNPPQVYVDGVLLPVLASEWVSGSEGIRATYLCNDTAASVIRIEGESNTATWGDPGTHALLLDNVVRSNQPPAASSTGRAAMRALDIGGSARTAGSLRVGHATTALGDTILYTTPMLASGYRPDLRRYKSAGSVMTVDAATVSGTREDGVGITEFAVPAALLPEGGYALVGRLRATGGGPTSGEIGWSAVLDVGSVNAGETVTVPAVPVTVDTTWQNVVLGGTTLPPTRVTSASGATIQISLDSTVPSLEWDEFWLFYLGDAAALTMVSCGSGAVTLGTAHNYLWTNTPTLARPEPEVMVGTLEDSSDAFHAGSLATAFGIHVLQPGENLLYLVSAAVNADLSARYYKRWHTHNADARTD